MKLAFETPQVEDMPLLQEFILKHQMAFMIEMDLEKAKSLVPEGIFPVEARPGVALAFIGYEHYNSGNLLYDKPSDEFYELTQFLVVQPDLSIEMPMPRYAFFVLQIASEDSEFIRQEIEIVKAKSYFSPTLKVQYSPDNHELTVEDENGPIQQFKNSHQNIEFMEDAFWGQYFSVMDGQLYVGVWNWRGFLFQHQKRGNIGQIYEHPFFENLSPNDLQECYMQLLTQPEELIRQRFYVPRPLWKV